MKKWLFPAIVGVVVLALGFSFSRKQMAVARAQEAALHAEMAAALAAQAAANAKSDDAHPAADESASRPGQPVVSSDAAASAAAKSDKPASSANDASKPDSSDRERGNPDQQSGYEIRGPQKLIYPVQHRDAASLVELLKQMKPATGDNVYADAKNNSLVCPGGFAQETLTILRLLDQPAPRKTFEPASAAPSEGRTSDSQTSPIFRPSAKGSQLSLMENDSRLLELPVRIKTIGAPTLR